MALFKTTHQLACDENTVLPPNVRLYDLQRSAVEMCFLRESSHRVSFRKFARDNGITERLAADLVFAWMADELNKRQRMVEVYGGMLARKPMGSANFGQAGPRLAMGVTA